MHEKLPFLPKTPSGKYVLIIHGGAGTLNKESSTPAQRAQYRAGLQESLLAGYEILQQGGEALDAVTAAVTAMEDNPLFNAGKGAVFNVAGKNELEVSIMLSKPPASHPNIPVARRGLGLTLLTRTKNPSQLVRALYLEPDRVPHTCLSGTSAEDIGRELGIELVNPSYFYTEKRWRDHRRGLGLPEEPLPYPRQDEDDVALDQMPKGTVGAVALDVRGCIAVLTSTGGKTNKLVGRVGDTPTMGSGFWAEEWNVQGWFHKLFRKKPRGIGVSGTGDGDFFIRLATASTLAHRIKFRKESLKKAGKYVVEELRRDGGLGGLISLDEKGRVSMPLNSTGMYRGVIREDGQAKTAIFDDDPLE